jgi:hypothetical protein
MVHNDGEVLVAPPERNLVDPDPPQPGEAIGAHTRATIDPTVRHAIRINSVTAVFAHALASHATVSSNIRVCPAS